MISRDEELNLLREELEATPAALEYTVQRAIARRSARRRKISRAVFAPLGSLTAVFAAFVLLVNVSPSFAYAAGQIPLIRELAQAVATSPSLSAAVENEYVQPIDMEQTQNGITARIEYAIVDQKQLNLFYTVEDEGGKNLRIAPELARSNGDLLSAGVTYGSYPGQEGIREVTADFFDSDVPESVDVTLRVYQEEDDEFKEEPVFAEDDDLLKKSEPYKRKFLAELHFTVSLDPYYTAQGESFEVNSPVVIDGQAFTLDTAEIYPTHMRFIFGDDPKNTAWLKSLEFYVENEKGERFDGVSNGVSASGSMESPMMETYMLESAFFAKSEHLTMYITGAKWLDKDCERVLVDLENESMDRVLADVRFEQAVKKQNGWVLTFSAPSSEKSRCYSVFGWSYYGLDGEEYERCGVSASDSSYFDEESGKFVPLTGRFYEEFALYDYLDSQVWLCPEFSRQSELKEPIAVKIK